MVMDYHVFHLNKGSIQIALINEITLFQLHLHTTDIETTETTPAHIIHKIIDSVVHFFYLTFMFRIICFNDEAIINFDMLYKGKTCENTFSFV